MLAKSCKINSCDWMWFYVFYRRYFSGQKGIWTLSADDNLQKMRTLVQYFRFYDLYLLQLLFHPFVEVGQAVLCRFQLLSYHLCHWCRTGQGNRAWRKRHPPWGGPTHCRHGAGAGNALPRLRLSAFAGIRLLPEMRQKNSLKHQKNSGFVRKKQTTVFYFLCFYFMFSLFPSPFPVNAFWVR